MVKIKEIPKNDRPIERLVYFGSQALSNEELLAILLKTGTKDISSKELASNILKDTKDLKVNDKLNIKLYKGEVIAEVKEIK